MDNMASKLCCTTDQEDHPDSPELPNARVAEALTPARLPLLPKPVGVIDSQFTSARSEDLHELRQIFNNAQESEPGHVSPTKPISRAHINKPSVYSLHSLHKMKSMRSLIRRKFSRDLSKKSSGDLRSNGARKGTTPPVDTVVKQLQGGPNTQVRITKDDLKKDLLSDKRPDQGGYDSDAQMLDDIAQGIGRKTSHKRPSIHSIDWTPSTASKTTPESSSKSRQSSNRTRDLQPYQIKPTQSVSLSNRLSQVFSTPNLQNRPKSQERKLRRSHSATSVRLPEYSPLSPLRLPSLKTHDQDGIPWSVALNESLKLSQLPLPAVRVTPKQSRSSLKVHLGSKGPPSKPQSQENSAPEETLHEQDEPPTPSTVVQIRVQEPTAMTTPRQSCSMRGIARRDTLSAKQDPSQEEDGNDEDRPRRSVHLYSMRISHHLRSGSLLSWDALADAPELPSPSSAVGDRSFSDLSKFAKNEQHSSRHTRQTSSSGFASSRVPSKWGKVVTNDIREDKSSIYSSRPQSPPDSFGGSMINLSRTPTKYDASTARSSLDLTRLRRSNSYPTDNDDTPKPSQKHGLTNLRDVTISSVLTQPSNEMSRLARNNSVASTKKSKFREEFSPSPPKKKLIPSVSIMRFFNSKRASARSLSEVNTRADEPLPAVDGSLEVPSSGIHRERRQSRSMDQGSLETEQKALGKDKKASPMWERALQNYQDERAAMFLPEHKDLATQTSPFRERSGSVSRPRVSEETEVMRKLSIPKRFSAPLLEPPSPGTVDFKEPPSLLTRRTAFAGADSVTLDSNHEAQMRFAQQTDTAETVGAWGRYPSHTRADRTFSAGHTDNVQTRDFALEAAIKFAMGKNSDGDEEEEVDPTARPTTPPLLPGQKKRKKKVGNTRMAKSHSMTFGKSFLKNYAKIFRSQSIEFHRHGSGHRSSIAAGGTLEYPELEILPDVWRRDAIEEVSRESSRAGGNGNEAQPTEEEYGPGDKKGKGKMKEDSASTLRPLAAGSRPTTSNLRGGLDGTRDTARLWSEYYENCLPSFPRASTELEFAFEDFGIPARRSLESRRASMQSRTMPIRYGKHSRNPSRMSHFSIASHASARPSFFSTGENDGGVDERSIVSVRRSTMDLISMYKEQENSEMERVLKMVRTGSSATLMGL